MDEALDDVIGERQRSDRGGRGRGPRRDRPDDRSRKNGRDDRQGIDDDWLHDRFDDASGDIRGGGRGSRRAYDRRQRRSPEPDSRNRSDEGAKIRVENIHYDLTEEDLKGLFSQIAPVTSLTITYDRSGRSLGTAYVTYRSMVSAREAIREFDGANANGQPIRLSVVPSAPRRNVFDSATKPGRSLLERVEQGRRTDSRSRDRSRSPPRRSDVTKPPPAGVDRYIPGERSRERTRSPPRRRRGDGARREGRRDKPGEGAARPKKTQEELDREMEDYFNKTGGAGAANGGEAPAAAAPTTQDMEIEMAE